MVTTDAIVEGVHFLPDDPPDTIARKALRVNLSDLAAKGATPAGFVLTLALRDADDAWLTPFARGLGEDAGLFGCPLLGGDTVSTPGPLMISITAFGRVPAGKMVHRSGAKPGDRVVVTGTIGDAALGLDILKGGAVAAALADDAAAKEMLVGRYRVPQPRNALAHGGSRSRQRGDGCVRWSGRRSRQTVRGVRRVRRDRRAEHSVVGGRRKRCWRAAQSASRPWFPAATITRFCAPFRRIASRRLRKAAALAEVAVTSIGTVIAGTSAPRFMDAQGREIALQRLSYSHF